VLPSLFLAACPRPWELEFLLRNDVLPFFLDRHDELLSVNRIGHRAWEVGHAFYIRLLEDDVALLVLLLQRKVEGGARVTAEVQPHQLVSEREGQRASPPLPLEGLEVIVHRRGLFLLPVRREGHYPQKQAEDEGACSVVPHRCPPSRS